MRRITMWLLSTIAAMVLLFSYRTSTGAFGGETTDAAPEPTTAPTTPCVDESCAGGASADPGADPSADPSAAGTGTGDSTGAGTGSATYDGSVEQTQYGPVQVRITVAGDKITDVAVVSYPNSSQWDRQVNDYALPILREQALEAQSAEIDTVSGATYTSEAYKQSLQAAIDAAHLS